MTKSDWEKLFELLRNGSIKIPYGPDIRSAKEPHLLRVVYERKDGTQGTFFYAAGAEILRRSNDDGSRVAGTNT